MLKPGTYCVRCHAPDPREVPGSQPAQFTCNVCKATEQRVLIIDPRVKTEETPRGLKHWTVGALIERDGKFLIMHKNTWPYLWDVIAGHLGVGEDPEHAVVREVKEETGLDLLHPRLAFHGEIFPEPCRRGVNIHEWYFYQGTADGELLPDPHEVRELRWLKKQEMVGLPFVRPAYFIFDAIGFWNDVTG